MYPLRASQRDHLPRGGTGQVDLEPARVLAELTGERVAVAVRHRRVGVTHIAVGARLRDAGRVEERRVGVAELVQPDAVEPGCGFRRVDRLGLRDARTPLLMRISARNGKQGRQDSNLQPPVLETGALPVELRPFGEGIVPG
jgi:hypothetical protein